MDEISKTCEREKAVDVRDAVVRFREVVEFASEFDAVPAGLPGGVVLDLRALDESSLRPEVIELTDRKICGIGKRGTNWASGEDVGGGAIGEASPPKVLVACE